MIDKATETQQSKGNTGSKWQSWDSSLALALMGAK